MIAAAQGDLFAPGPKPSTIEEERRRIDGAIRDRKRVVCRCCDQVVQVYRRHLNATQARCLIGLLVASREAPGGWVHVSRIPLGAGDARSAGGEFAKLKHWGLVEEATNDDETKRRAGTWRLTPSGEFFARGASNAPAWIDVCRNKVIDRASEQITITDALGERFDYRKIYDGALDVVGARGKR